ncbi:MAG: 6-phosphogluconolactonase, partial [Nitrospira sp.]|nr:6-phosphogluconolactonase [Nitrospira sp.]
MAVAPQIVVAHDGETWANEAASILLSACEAAIQSRGRCLLALSGGSTPRTLYAALTSDQWRNRFDWSKIFFLFGDERCVPPDHHDSNFGTARLALFQPLNIREDHIFRMRGEDRDPQAAVRDYESVLRRLTTCAPPDLPRLDVILLGVGDDGHTASLFPGTAALHENSRAVTVGLAPTGIRSRLTLTLGVLNRASVILFLVTGAQKAPVVRRILSPQSEADRTLPAALVAPDHGRLIWVMDRSAASQLPVHNLVV